jgi:hypothetical protein
MFVGQAPGWKSSMLQYEIAIMKAGGIVQCSCGDCSFLPVESGPEPPISKRFFDDKLSP